MSLLYRDKKRCAGAGAMRRAEPHELAATSLQLPSYKASIPLIEDSVTYVDELQRHLNANRIGTVVETHRWLIDAVGCCCEFKSQRKRKTKIIVTGRVDC